MKKQLLLSAAVVALTGLAMPAVALLSNEGEETTETGAIPDPSTWTALDRSNWQISGCSQYGAANGDGPLTYAIDGNAATYWHSNYNSDIEKQAPHFFIIDLGEGEHAYDGFGYLPRQSDNGNGFCQEYAVYTTDSTEGLITFEGTGAQTGVGAHESIVDYMDENTPAAEGNMGYQVGAGANRAETRVHFAETKSERYVIFVFKSTANAAAGKIHATCAEFNLYSFRDETPVEPDPEPQRPALTAADDDALVNVADLTDGTITNNGKVWTSNTTPAFTLTLEGDGEMEMVDEPAVFRIACGNNINQHVTITVASADPAYYVSGYVFDATGYAGDQAVITYGDKSITTDETIKYAWLDPIEEGTAATFTAATAVAGHAKKPIISNFDVRFTPATFIPDPEPEIPDPSTWTALDRSNWQISGCSQRGSAGDTDGGFNEAKDGNANTYWHSNWEQADYEHAAPHFLVIDLGEGEHAYDGIGYLPRQNTNGGNGYCNDYAVYVTDDISEIDTATSEANSCNTEGHSSISDYMEANTPAAEGTMTYTISNTNRPETRVHFAETKSERYVIFVFKSTANSETANSHANCAELNLYVFRTEPIPVDHRPAGIAWLDNMAKLTVLYDADAINAAKDAVNALADDATEEEVMAAAKTVYDNDPAIGKQIRFHSVKTADTEDAAYYLGGNDENLTYITGEEADSDLSTIWTVAGTEIPGAYRLLNYGKQLYAGYTEASNTRQPWDEEGEMFEFVVPADVDGGCTLEEANQLAFIAHSNATDPTGYVHFGKNGDDADQWMITTWSISSAGSQWRISLADDNAAEVTGTYDSETGIYTIASADAENPFSHNATRHSTHTIALISDETDGATGAEVELTDNGDGTFGLDLKERPLGQYAITIPMGYFATPAGFSAAHSGVINHDYQSSITEVNAAAGATEWYNMQGMRVAAPVKGGVYIRATSAGAEKVLVK